MKDFIKKFDMNSSFAIFEHLTVEIHIWKIVRGEGGDVQTWRLTYANPTALKTWGFDSLDEIERKTTDQIFGEGATEHYLPVVKKILEEKTPHHFTDYFENLDKHFNFTSIPFDDFFITTGEDITELVKEREAIQLRNDELNATTHALAKSELRMRIAADSASMGVWDFNIDKNELIWDEQMYKLYGVASDAFSGAYEAWTNGLHPDDLEMAERAFNDAVSGDGDFHTVFRVKHPKGDIRWIKADAWTQKDPFDGFRHMVGINQDITSQKEAELLLMQRQLELEKASRVKSEFLASMSHELRTPMTTVLGYTDLMLEDSLLKGTTRQNCEKIKHATSSLLHIINGILDMSKLESGKLDLEYLDFNFNTFIEDVMSVFKSNRSGDGVIDWQLHIDDDIPAGIHSDPTRLRQVLFNLLGNAQKFTSEGRISVSCERIEQQNAPVFLRLSVQDSGIGLKEGIIEKIFEPFEQADSTISRKFSGTGLGLPISKKIVELLGGELDATGTEGEGSTFSFTIPLIESKGNLQEVQRALTASSYKAVRPLDILLAEDNRVNSILAKKVLTGYGHKVTLAENGQEAIDAHRANDHDLILMDIRMPEVDGIEATLLIRALADGKSTIPIIAITADVMKGQVKTYLENGFNDYTSKPFNWPQLLLIINKVLGEDIHVLCEPVPNVIPLAG